MTIANQVTYRDMDPSQTLSATIEKRLQKLERYANDVKYSRVVLESPHNHKYKGKDFRATVELEVKGNPITITQNNPSIHVAVRDAFNIAERKLKSHSKQLQHKRDGQFKRNVPYEDDIADEMAG